jgi:hypothetical protein
MDIQERDVLCTDVEVSGCNRALLPRGEYTDLDLFNWGRNSDFFGNRNGPKSAFFTVNTQGVLAATLAPIVTLMALKLYLNESYLLSTRRADWAKHASKCACPNENRASRLHGCAHKSMQLQPRGLSAALKTAKRVANVCACCYRLSALRNSSLLRNG